MAIARRCLWTPHKAMFATRYFCQRYFAARYWPKAAAASVSLAYSPCLSAVVGGGAVFADLPGAVGGGGAVFDDKPLPVLGGGVVFC